jgi:hypothetical protein
MTHEVDLKTLTKEELQVLKQKYEDQREVYCQEYLVYANKCIEHMEDPDQRDFWDAKIKELEGPTQNLKHLIMDCINAIQGIDNQMGNVMPGKETVK